MLFSVTIATFLQLLFLNVSSNHSLLIMIGSKTTEFKIWSHSDGSYLKLHSQSLCSAVSEVCSIDTCTHCGTFTCKSCYCLSYYWGFASICSFGRISYPQPLRFVFTSALLNLLFEYLVITKFTICHFEERLAGKI